MEKLILALIILGCAGWVWLSIRKIARKSSDCDSGCSGGCGCGKAQC